MPSYWQSFKQYIDWLGFFAPSPTSSALYAKLCDRQGGATGQCRFPVDVVLKSDLPCHGMECRASEVRSVRMVDGNTTVYYQYHKVPCVRLTMPQHGMRTAWRWGGRMAQNFQCADRRSPVAVVTCCDKTTGRTQNLKGGECTFAGEDMSFDTASARCHAAGRVLCKNFDYPGQFTQWRKTCAFGHYAWMNRSCSVQVRVHFFLILLLMWLSCCHLIMCCSKRVWGCESCGPPLHRG